MGHTGRGASCESGVELRFVKTDRVSGIHFKLLMAPTFIRFAMMVERGIGAGVQRNQRLLQFKPNLSFCIRKRDHTTLGVAITAKLNAGCPTRKIRDKKKSIGWSTWLDTYGFNSDGTRELKELFGEKN